MIIGRPKFVLASGSPRRLTLINQVGIEPDALRPADIDEMPKRGELPRACANRLARGKAEAALAAVKLDDELSGSYILAADTVVAVGRRILPKADLLDEAAQCLRLLSGRNHRVHTGVCLVTPKEAFRQRLVETRVRFKRLSEQDIEAYLASGEWRGKAGGYAAQGLAGSFIVKIVGSYTNVVGLPLYETATLLSGEGFPIHFGWLNAVCWHRTSADLCGISMTSAGARPDGDEFSRCGSIARAGTIPIVPRSASARACCGPMARRRAGWRGWPARCAASALIPATASPSSPRTARTIVEVLYAIWHAGLAAVPANAKLHGAELGYILEQSGARVCFASEGLDAELGAARARKPGTADRHRQRGIREAVRRRRHRRRRRAPATISPGCSTPPAPPAGRRARC